ncbi:tyrosine-type recombinase/integrase [Latilactobacillus sakei]|uniref:tyrosine-type recombinase/integrase n=1 Tax=Latilactobacillus sakei TaxID=1599 RepID=UPI00115764F4|nr:tyrosine-type recombinase/integrase [Latilactobacillus sakei]MDM5043860.1 tyrosine-type recombinase/integrase [Latilactobacillus sakei]WEY49810.1 tyrosine-type recombinase/integrase [Latilactobacillus sakei]VTU49612.1 site-specific integrase [Lactobacillus curvatus] [Latilactobacillus sakei]
MAEGNVRKRGDKWYYSFEAAQVDGKRKRIERVGGYSEKEARKALRKAIDEYENGNVQIKLDKMSVADYFNYWLVNYVERNLKYNTVKNYRNILKKYIIPKLGKYRVRTLSPEMLQEFIDDIADNATTKQGNPLAQHTVAIIFTVTKEALRRAVFPYRIIKDNPMAYVDMPKYEPQPKKTKQDLKIISLDQYRELLNYFPVADSFHMPLVIAFNTGMRRGEICALTWNKIDLVNNTITVDSNMIQHGKGTYELASPKTKASYRTIDIGQTLVNELKEKRKSQMENQMRYGHLYDKSNFVCTEENGSPVLPNTIKYKSRLVQEKLHMNFNFHSLRHTHATMLLEAGEKMKVVSERLGHSRISTTMDTYSHVTHKMRKNTVSLIEQIQNE